MNPRPRLDRHDWTLVLLISLLALALRIPFLDRGPWFDEIITQINFVRRSFIDIWLAPFHLNNHMLYSLFARASVSLFGESTWALRLPAMLFGTATVPALYYLGRQLDRRDLAVLASLFLATNYYHIWFSQNARGYTGMALGAVAASIILVKILQNRDRSKWLWASYVLSAIFTASFHLLGALVIISHGLLCLPGLLKNFSEKDWKRLGYVASLFLASGLITLLIFAHSLYLATGSFAEVLEPTSTGTVTAPVESGLFPRKFLFRVIDLNKALPGGLLTAYILGLVALAGVRNTIGKVWNDAGLLLLPIAITVLTVYLVSAHWLPRFLFANAGFLVMVGCRGGFEIGRLLFPAVGRRTWFTAGCLLAFASLIAVPHAWKPKQDVESLGAWLAESSRPGDVRACLPVMKSTVRKYLGYDCAMIRTVEQLQALERPGKRTVFLVSGLSSQFNDNNRALPNYLRNRYELALSLDASVKNGEIKVFILDPQNSSSSATGIRQ